MEDRSLISFVLGSLMVAEERITTKFSGLVGAEGSEEEITFLATQQVDEARHMQFYARFQDEVVSEPALIATHVERARSHVSPAFRTIFDEQARRGARAARRQPGRSTREGRVRDDLPPGPRGHARAHHFEFATLPEREACCRDSSGLHKIHHDEQRHIGYGVWFLRKAVTEDPGNERRRARDSPRPAPRSR